MKAQESDMREGNGRFSFTTESSIMAEARVIDDENDPFWDLLDPGIAATRWTPGGSSSDTKPSSFKRKRSLCQPPDPPAGDDIDQPSRLSKYLHDETVGSIAIEWYSLPAFVAIGVGAQVLEIQWNPQVVIYIILICVLWTTFSVLYFLSGAS